MKIAVLIFLIVLVIGFFVVVWKASRDWRWYQIVGAVITMLLAVTFMFPTAGVLKSRREWNKVYEEQTVLLETVSKKQNDLKYGNPSDPEVGEGLIVMSQRLSMLGLEVGRRWRNLRLTNVNGAAITLAEMADPNQQQDPAPEGEAAGPAPTGPLIAVGTVVYGFGEQPQPNTPLPIPVFYLGEFRVTAATPTEVTVTPTGPLETAQEQTISSRQAVSWSIYEMLPLDGHNIFIAPGSESSNENLFGRVDDELVRRLLGNRVTPETLNSFLRDGARATPNDPPATRWVKLEFTKNHREQVDSPDKAGALDGGYFDGVGRSVDSRLQRGGDGFVEFKTGTQIVVKEEAAKSLLDQNAARLIDTYYIRPLSDYRYVLRQIRLRLVELAIREKELEYENRVLTSAINTTIGMITINQDVRVKLEQDLAQTQVEHRTIKTYHDKVQQEVNQIRQKLADLYESNQRHEQQLDNYFLRTNVTDRTLTSVK